MAQHSHSGNLRVIYEDNHLIAVNKRPGDIVQGDKTGDTPLSDIVKAYIKQKYRKPGKVFLGVVHRLDRPTSGIVIFARTSKALTRLNRSFAQKENTKIYWAIVAGLPEKPGATLKHWLRKNPVQNKSYPVKAGSPGAKEAILSYKLIKPLDRYSLLEIELLTGRHHQIRAQLAAVGLVVKGDLKYGAKRSNEDGSIHLHARLLRLLHPVKNEEMEFTAPPPDDALWNNCV